MRVNSTLSDWESVISGVLQGSMLGPILFIFSNDLKSCVTAKLSLFADGTKLIKMLLSITSFTELQNGLNNLIFWSEKWQFKFNIQSAEYSVLDLWKQNHTIFLVLIPKRYTI